MSQSTPQLMISIKKHCMNLECSVCYKKINRTYFICSSPCNKVFHMDCMYKMMDRTEEAAYEANEYPQHKCCYCRRSINMRNYLLKNYADTLLISRNTGYYDVSNPMYKVVQYKSCVFMGKPEEDISYENYELIDTTRVKKPKQANLKKKQTFVRKQPRVHVKQNISGRRRS